METFTTIDNDILYITDQPVPARAARRISRVLTWIGASLAAALVVGVSFTAIERAVRESRKTKCADQIRLLGGALQEYEASHGQFPAPAFTRGDGTKLLSWRVAILPQLGCKALYERFHLDESWDSPHNRSLIQEMPAVFGCPAGPWRQAGETSYVVVVGPETDAYSVNTPFEPTRGADIRHITDGTSGTILVLETDKQIPWTKPDDVQWTKGAPLPHLASPHAGGSHAVFVDGATRFLKSTIEPRTFEAILTINGGEVLSGSG
jgi:hypothetical protein